VVYDILKRVVKYIPHIVSSRGLFVHYKYRSSCYRHTDVLHVLE